jgi:transmembrane sensor
MKVCSIVILLFLSSPAFICGNDGIMQLEQKRAFIKGRSFSSPLGKRQRVILPDQTEVTLNSNTTLWLDKDFGKSNRNVQVSGDALFKIRKKSRPFIIYTPHLILTSDSAIARVNAYAQDAGEETLLLSGKMKVVKSYYSKLDHEPYFLKGGDMVMMNKDIDLMEKETFDARDLNAWLENRMVLKNSSVNELTNTLKKWFNAEINVTGNVPSNLRYSGTFTGADLQQILNIVGKAWRFSYQAGGNTISIRF